MAFICGRNRWGQLQLLCAAARLISFAWVGSFYFGGTFLHPLQTPWIIINLTVPLCFLTGVGISVLFEYLKDPVIKIVVVGELLLAAAITFYGAYVLAMSYFGNRTMPTPTFTAFARPTFLNSASRISCTVSPPSKWQFI